MSLNPPSYFFTSPNPRSHTVQKENRQMPGKSAQASTETEDAKGVRRDCFDFVEDYWRNAEISGAPCKELLVVMPAYNEEECVAQVIDAWAPELRKVAGESFRLLLLNDGSKDRTGETLQGLRSRHPELLVVNKPNSGHGQTCIDGYRFGVAKGYSWILQIDSDGQCDPCFFPAFWNSRAAHRVLFGFRVQRDDGFSRRVILAAGERFLLSRDRRLGARCECSLPPDAFGMSARGGSTRSAGFFPGEHSHLAVVEEAIRNPLDRHPLPRPARRAAFRETVFLCQARRPAVQTVASLVGDLAAMRRRERMLKQSGRRPRRSRNARRTDF